MPRIAWFITLDGSIPRPLRDQGIYIRMAGRVASGQGLSYCSDICWLKNNSEEESTLQHALSSAPGYIFGIVPEETPTASIEPGYPLLLGFLFMLFGPITGAVFLLNCSIAILGALAIWKLVSENWGTKAALLASLTWAVYPYYVYYSAYAMTDSLHISMLPILTWLTLRSVSNYRSGFSAGIVSGLLFLIRSTVIFLLPLQMLYLFLRKRWKAGLFLFAGFVLCCIPWVVRNQVELGSPVLLPTKGSLNLWMRNSPDIIAIEGIILPEWIDDGINRRDLLEYPLMDGAVTELERSSILSERATAFIIANPVLILYLSMIRFVLFISPVGGTIDSIFSLFVGILIYLPVLVMAVIEIIHRRRDGRILFLACVFLIYLGLHSLAHGGVRYRLPVDMVLIVFTALFISRRAGWERKNT
ncbi:MAG: hypothetical protein GQ565_12520 [Candidatus Aegiribacteria sp.]|nr:hypothetical protein [Candidatus Aegiribacteria sp.]